MDVQVRPGPAPPPDAGADATPGGPTRPPMAKWVRVMLAVATLLVVVGIGMRLLEPDPPASNLPQGAAALSAQSADAPPQEESWAPGFLKMGFSFFVGFALGYAARKFLKIGLIFCGVLFALLYLGSYLGWIEVHWNAMDQSFQNLTGGLRAQFESIKSFVTGSLPAAGLGSVGLYAGFRQG